MKKLIASTLNAIRLPAEMTQFERRYLHRINRIAMWFFALHVPVFMAVAYANDTGPSMAALLTSMALLGPFVASRTFENPRHVSMVHGFTSMLMGGLLVHFGQGPVQIEMHFYFFALLAMLSVFANPMVIVVAAGTVAVHHLALWYYLPASVFNYDAPLWVVLVHAAFVVLESVAAVYIARSFFDNVIGLERIVQARTVELDDKNRRMRLVLDNVEQGLLTVDPDGIMSAERSAVVDRWLGASTDGERLVDSLRRRDSRAADAFEAAYDQLTMDILPLDVALDQFPRTMSFDERYFGLDYTPIVRDGEFAQLLVVLTDRTAVVEREQMEMEQRETMILLQRARIDETGFLEFFEEAKVLALAIATLRCDSLPLLSRMIHTLKGNAMLFEVKSVAAICEQMEDEIDETGKSPNEALLTALSQRWEGLRESLRVVLDAADVDVVRIGSQEYRSLLKSVVAEPCNEDLPQMLLDLTLETTKRRLERFGEQARQIADRLEKPGLVVKVVDHGHRIDPTRWSSFWQHFVHVIRNAVDHGLEAPQTRVSKGKPECGTLTLTTLVEGGEFRILVHDDGAGIDWDRVRDRAARLGVPHDSRADLELALFHDGLTTREIATMHSGRGVGLAAVRSACEARGGRIQVSSRLGAGTTFEFSFPAAEMAPSPDEFLAA